MTPSSRLAAMKPFASKRAFAPLPLGLLLALSPLAALAHAEQGHSGGFVAGLHGLLGETRRWSGGRRFVQVAGGVVALAGLFFLERALS